MTDAEAGDLWDTGDTGDTGDGQADFDFDFVLPDDMVGFDMFDRDGMPIDFMTAARLSADRDYKQVGLDRVGPYEISTVWLGQNHARRPGEPPVIFETLVFDAGRNDPDGSPVDGARYATEGQARAGHEAFVTLLRGTVQATLDTDTDTDTGTGDAGTET